MLRITTLGTAAEISRYYVKGRSQEAYYSDNQEFNGCWGGKAASLLGLDGYVDGPSFERLSNNRHPKTGEQLTARMRADRRSGFDLTFDVPKSLSVVWAYTQDDRIIRAVRQTVRDLRDELETAAAARVRSRLGKNADEDRPTGNIVSAEFVHLSARPENGYSDPHLHVHLVVFNLTLDPIEKKWKALQMGDIHEDVQYYEAAFHMHLAENLKALGLDILPTKHAFEIAGIPHGLNEIFSRRTKKINETAEKLGITDPAQKAKLGAMTRERKNTAPLIDDLRQIWFANLNPEHEAALMKVQAILRRSLAQEMSQQIAHEKQLEDDEKATFRAGSEAFGKRKKGWAMRRESQNRRTRPGPTEAKSDDPTEHDRRALGLAIRHLFERKSVVSEKQLLNEAYRSWCIGKATRMGIAKVLAETPLIRASYKGKLMLTTREVLEEEKLLVKMCLDGKWKCESLNPFWKIEEASLNEQQRKAVAHVLNSRDWVMGISGRAGTGKTTLLHEVRRGVERGMYKLIALAPTSEAARDTLRKEGFANAETVAKFLVSDRLQQEARGGVLLIDEAGLLSLPQTLKLFLMAKQLGARLIFIGDTSQHHSVERGQAFHLLQKFAHLEVATVEDVMRQRGAYKEFVERLANAEVGKAFEILKAEKWIVEMTLEQRKIALATEYIKAIKAKKTALVVAPTHAECDDVNRAIRESLKSDQRLKGGVEWDILRDLAWSEAEKSDLDHYRRELAMKKGRLVVQINRHVEGFALGEQMEVIGVRDGVVRVRSTVSYHPRIKPLPLGNPDTFSIYERGKMEICEGEEIRITSNSRTADGHRLDNRKQYFVDYIDPKGRLVLDNGWRLEKDFAHLKYAYSSTSHSAQSKTVDVVLVAQTAKLSTHASDLQQFYVSTTRARSEIKIYTDDIELLMANVSRIRERPMAMEMLAQAEDAEKSDTAKKSSKEMGRMTVDQVIQMALENPELRRRMKKAQTKSELGCGMAMEM